MPIDYIHFGDDMITFIEVKSGNARLSHSQKRVQQQVLDNKIQFKTFRVK
jgi:predicted Holliday junction resolvase-like endonuclease